MMGWTFTGAHKEVPRVERFLVLTKKCIYKSQPAKLHRHLNAPNLKSKCTKLSYSHLSVLRHFIYLKPDEKQIFIFIELKFDSEWLDLISNHRIKFAQNSYIKIQWIKSDITKYIINCINESTKEWRCQKSAFKFMFCLKIIT